jgi:hypothetical protein
MSGATPTRSPAEVMERNRQLDVLKQPLFTWMDAKQKKQQGWIPGS